MTAEGNKAVVRRLFEEVSTRVTWGAPGQAPGLEGFKQVNTMLCAAFPDLRLTVEEMVAEGDRVSVRFTPRGTHLGEFWGVPPTGSRVAWEVISIVRVAGGKIAERWSQSDVASLRQQVDDG